MPIMMPAAALGIKATKIDFRKSLLETAAIKERAKQLLHSPIEGPAWRAAPSFVNGRSTADVATHIHGVRTMWLSAADRTTNLPTKLDHDQAKRAEAQADLKVSSEAILVLPRRALDAGKVPHCQPHAVAFTDHLIARDSRHRRQIAILGRQQRECGFGK
jgi:hypothetical protein